MSGDAKTAEAKQAIEKAKNKKPTSALRWALKQVNEFQGWDTIFRFLIIAFVCWGLYLGSNVYEHQTDPKWASIKKYSITDFYIVIPLTAMFFFARYLCDLAFTDWIIRNLDNEKFPTQEDKAERAKKSCKWIFSVIYYSFSTVACFLICYDQYFFPPMLLGKGNSRDLFKYTPNAPPDMPYANSFYMLQFSCHFYSLLDHVIFKWRDPKFWEMFLHHAVAVFLIFFSYMCGEISAGLLVLFCHDSGDVFLDLSRLLNDMKKEKVGIMVHVSWATFMFDWIYFRLFAFPKFVVSECLYDMAYGKGQSVPGPLVAVYAYICAMLCALVFLHIYWFVFMSRITINILRKKKEFNTYDNKKAKKQG